MTDTAGPLPPSLVRRLRVAYRTRSVRTGLGRTGRTVILVLGFLLGGLVGLAVATAALVAVEVEPDHVVARGAAASLALAAIATVLETWPADDFDLRFSTERPIAGGLAKASAILLVTAVAVRARLERAPEPMIGPRLGDRRAQASVVRTHAASAVGVAAFAAGAVTIRVMASPAALPAGYARAVAGLRAGHWVPTALHPPLATIVAALGPLSPRWSTILATLLTAGVVTTVGWRLGGRRVGVLCGVLAAVLPSVWGQQLPEALAALGVAGGIAWAWPERVSMRRAVLAGLALGAAALARPEALLAIPVVAAWLVLAPGDRRVAARWGNQGVAAVVVVAALAAYGPWAVWMHHHFDTWLPTTSLGPTLAGATTPRTQHPGLFGAFDPEGVTGAGAADALSHPGEIGRDHAFRTLAHDNLEQRQIPALVVARVLRGWGLRPVDQRYAREHRGLPAPGGMAGAVGEMAVSVLAIGALVAERRRWRELFPMFALLGLFTLESALLFGDVGLRGWVAPSIVLAAALGIQRGPRPLWEFVRVRVLRRTAR
jgi:hypothetical protein